MRSTCSCKDYFHDKMCVHVLCMIAMSLPEFQIPVALIQCDLELRRRRGRRKYVAGEDIRQVEVIGRWNPTMAEPLQLGVMPMPRNLIAGKVLDAPERDGFIRPPRPQVPAWKAKAGRYDSSEVEDAADDDDVSTAGCSSKMGISTDYERVEALGGNKALFGLESEDGDGGMGIEENFFRGPIALEV